MLTVYLIRHAQASLGHENYDQLSDLGKKQAAVLGDYFSKLKMGFDAVYCGSMKRHEQTAEIVMSKLQNMPDIIYNTDFNEYDSFGVFNSQIDALAKEDPVVAKQKENVFKDMSAFRWVFNKVVTRWMSGNYDVEGVETCNEFIQRCERGILKLKEQQLTLEPKRIAVFTSGGTISIITRNTLELSEKKTIDISWQIYNSSVSIFKCDEKVFDLHSFNSIAHLELLCDQSIITYI